MPTISGMRRRGYPPAAINRFCTEIGVTRNAKLIEYEKLLGNLVTFKRGRLTHRNHSTHTPEACEAALRSARRDEKLQRGARVIEGSLLVRRPSPELTALEDAWWEAYNGGGCDRDQPAFALALFEAH